MYIFWEHESDLLNPMYIFIQIISLVDTAKVVLLKYNEFVLWNIATK